MRVDVVMLRIVNCITDEHDLRLVALSALICALGCFTTVSLLARSNTAQGRETHPWIVAAAVIFGLSVWSLHFVAMLAFMPGEAMAYDVELTALSAVIATVGALVAFIVWRLPATWWVGVGLGGVALGLSISGMHYVGVAAMRFSGVVRLEPAYVAASVVASAVFALVALARMGELHRIGQRLEAAAWLALAICGLHFTGMTAVTVARGLEARQTEGVVGTASLAAVVAAVSLVILAASLTAILVEQTLSHRALKELGRMRLLSNLAQEVLFIHHDGIVLEVNSAGERLFKTPSSQMIGRPVLSLFAESCVPALIRRTQCPPQKRRPEELEIQAADGTRVPVELSCQPIEYRGKSATAVALRDLTDRKRDEARIRYLARHDALTDLPNRYNLQERLEAALEMPPQDGSGLAILYIDLDRFKPVNDLLGHAAGDTVLVQVAQRLRAEVHATETLARIGGDEFVIVLADGAHPDKVSLVATRVIESLKRPFQVEGHRIEVGASLGIALYPGDGDNAETLLRAADAAMYRVKEEGRGGLRFYEASMNAQLQARLQLKQELSGAIERDELLLHYQPIANGVTGEIETFEALIRWWHPKRGMVSPVEFIPLAEETGLIAEIGRWVIDTAFQAAAAWPHPWRVSVNVSPVQFRQSDLCGAIAAALKANGLDPSRVVVEITEGVLMEDAPTAVTVLNRLRELGIRLALDDFGTGYSSLSYLQLFKFDKFKIDKSFVTKLGQSDDALTITRTIVNLGHNLGLQVTAEGVETQAQLAILQGLGCNQIQGYLVARPAPFGTFMEIDRARTRALFTTGRARLSA